MKLEQYNELVSQCKKESKEKIVFADGPLKADIVLIGEAPGKNEIENGKPFCGAAGKELDSFIEILEINREDIYITNVVKIRPIKTSKAGNKINRPPNSKEINLYKKYLFREIDLINPKIIVTLGNVPLKTMIKNKKATIGEYHGKLMKIKEGYLFPLYHPASVIYNKSLKDTYISDLKTLKKVIEKL